MSHSAGARCQDKKKMQITIYLHLVVLILALPFVRICCSRCYHWRFKVLVVCTKHTCSIEYGIYAKPINLTYPTIPCCFGSNSNDLAPIFTWKFACSWPEYYSRVPSKAFQKIPPAGGATVAPFPLFWRFDSECHKLNYSIRFAKILWIFRIKSKKVIEWVSSTMFGLYTTQKRRI